MNAGMRHLGIVAFVLLSACGPKGSATTPDPCKDPCKDVVDDGPKEPEGPAGSKEVVGVLDKLELVDGVCTAVLIDDDSGVEIDYHAANELCTSPEHQKCLGAKVVMTLMPCEGNAECGADEEHLVTAIDMF